MGPWERRIVAGVAATLHPWLRDGVAAGPRRPGAYPTDPKSEVVAWFDDGMVTLEKLPTSPRLRGALRSWAQEWELILDPAFEVREKDRYRRWVVAGRGHASDPQAELGPSYRVVYWHEDESAQQSARRDPLSPGRLPAM